MGRLTPREQEILRLLRSRPLLDAQGIAQLLGTTKGAVAVVLSSLTRKGEIVGRAYLVRDEPCVAVLGGSVIDLKARSAAELVEYTSNPATISTTPGGVGRNIAENLARMGRRTRLVSVVGRDAFGKLLIEQTAAAGVGVEDVVRTDLPTGTYLAALDADGELHVGMSDMRATDELTVAMLAPARDAISRADVVVVDGNMPAAVAGWAIDLAKGNGVPVVIEPVSVAKAARIAPLLNANRPVRCVTPNLSELSELVGSPVKRDQRSIASAASDLHARGVEQVWVRLGTEGSLLCVDGAKPVALDAQAAEVVDVTGAGDSMTAAFVHATMRGFDAADAARFGHAAAALTIASHHTVRPDLTEAGIDQQLAAARG